MITKARSAVSTLLPSRRWLPAAQRSKLLVGSGADPWVIRHKNYYYYCRSVGDRLISVNKSKYLKDIGSRTHVVWAAAEGSRLADEVWAPELHYLKGKWYIYFTAGKGPAHRMYVLESLGNDPQGEYRLKGKIADATDKWAIDGTVLQINQELYFVWSGWEGNADGQQNLYIAAMPNPWEISGKRVCISEPEYIWERIGKPYPYVNEGPQALRHGKKLFIIYSASHSATDDYCLGQLTYTGGNPLSKDSWLKKSAPVFIKNNAVFGPGHASFFKGFDHRNWIVYHTAIHSQAGWNRQVQAQKFVWHKDGSPNFGSALEPVKH